MCRRFGTKKPPTNPMHLHTYYMHHGITPHTECVFLLPKVSQRSSFAIPLNKLSKDTYFHNHMYWTALKKSYYPTSLDNRFIAYEIHRFLNYINNHKGEPRRYTSSFSKYKVYFPDCAATNHSSMTYSIE